MNLPASTRNAQSSAQLGETPIFRPPILLRLFFGFVGAICALGALSQLWLLLSRGEPLRLASALVVGAPSLLAVAVWRKAVIVQEEGLRSATLWGSRLIPWTAVRRIDQTRRSFVVETQAGPVSAGWLAQEERDRLMRLVMEKARLMASRDRLRWGLIAQYVPRAQTVTFGEYGAQKRRRETGATP